MSRWHVLFACVTEHRYSDDVPARSRPVGTITRGTTNPNRLRRADRYAVGPLASVLHHAMDPLVVDLGFGAAATTTVEMSDRFSRVRPDIEVVGVEIDPDRVTAAQAFDRPGLSFRRGGFEIPIPGRSPAFIRAFNVLRQYDERDVPAAWELACSRLAPGGVFMDGTCDEIGRRATWLCGDATGPLSLTISMRLGSFQRPSDVAERLPKALIHHNVPGERIQHFLSAADAAWLALAPLASFGSRQRWLAMCARLRAEGWPVLHRESRWRLGELTVAWDAVKTH